MTGEGFLCSVVSPLLPAGVADLDCAFCEADDAAPESCLLAPLDVSICFGNWRRSVLAVVGLESTRHAFGGGLIALVSSMIWTSTASVRAGSLSSSSWIGLGGSVLSDCFLLGFRNGLLALFFFGEGGGNN